MQREFLQEKSLNRSLDNAEKSLNVDLSAKSRLIPYSTSAGMLGLNDLYLSERDACETYRMVFTVNPVCTNALFNAVTEPVFKEGSDETINLVQASVGRTDQKVFPEGTMNQSGGSVDQIAAVRDTEYSHERIGDFVYHCGYDLFNNHLLRSNEFEHVQMDDTSEHLNKNFFNTIFDFAVDYSGKTVTRVTGESKGPFRGGKISERDRENIRMYQLDNIKSINASFYDGLRLVDGWYGFYNIGYINIPNGELKGEKISLNKVINNEPACGFIDMYPDRSLYSFIPKPNRFRKRLERNWDCTIVYPFESDYDMFNKVNGNEANAIKVINRKIVYNNVGDELIQMHSLLRNTLQPGDYVRLFYKAEDSDDIKRFSLPVRVIGVGDNDHHEENKYFTIKLSDVSTFCEVDTETKEIMIKGATTGVPICFFYKKIDNGYDDKYYFRKFKELKNYQYVEVDPETLDNPPVPVSRIPNVVNEYSPTAITLGYSCFKLDIRPLTYTQNKIAFASSIYGDRVAQVIFNDDISISGLKDNIGRPLSSVYFMVVKTNRGHKEWYDEGNTTGETIEYSHCFGDITTGLDLPMDDESTDYNVRKLYNVFVDDCANPEEYKNGLISILSDAPTGDFSGTPMPLESAITIDINSEDYKSEFYGDIVEFSKVDFREKVIEKVYHRFNTAQRECVKNDKYFDIHYDDLVGDIYDVKEIS